LIVFGQMDLDTLIIQTNVRARQEFVWSCFNLETS